MSRSHARGVVCFVRDGVCEILELSDWLSEGFLGRGGLVGWVFKELVSTTGPRRSCAPRFNRPYSAIEASIGFVLFANPSRSAAVTGGVFVHRQPWSQWRELFEKERICFLGRLRVDYVVQVIEHSLVDTGSAFCGNLQYFCQQSRLPAMRWWTTRLTALCALIHPSLMQAQHMSWCINLEIFQDSVEGTKKGSCALLFYHLVISSLFHWISAATMLFPVGARAVCQYRGEVAK